MCRIAAVLALMAVSVAMVTPANGGIKWLQPPGMDYQVDWQSWGISDTFFVYQVADDFMCRDGHAVTEVHWWGSYIPNKEGDVYAFVIQFWSNVPESPYDPFSHPDAMIQDEVFFDVPETYYGTTAGGEDVYEYHVELTKPFEQVRGETYWISIVAVMISVDPVWGWHESDVQWQDSSVTRGPTYDWNPNEQEEHFWHPVDMSFYLSTEGDDNGAKWVQPPDMDTGFDAMSQTGKIDREVADDFECEDGDPIDEVVWWGSYPGPHGDATRVSEFIIRFYSDVPADGDSYSHPGTLLYEESITDFMEFHIFTTPDGEKVFRYSATLDPNFEQEEGKIYWISIVAVLELPAYWGWHESEDHWNDAAVVRAVDKWYVERGLTGGRPDMSFGLGTTGGVYKWWQAPIATREGDIVSQSTTDTALHRHVADDFLCEDGSPISHVHWWGSYLHNVKGPVDAFWIRFYSDVPWDRETNDHSHPGDLLAEYAVQDYNETLYGTVTLLGEDVYQYYAKLPEPFEQEQGEVYWISIVAAGPTPPTWGWHDSRFRWNDRAVFRNLVFGPVGWEIQENRFLDVATDMAFELTSPVTVTAPSGWFSPGWVWFSIPVDPVGSSEVSDVLGFDATNRVYRWDPVGKNTELYPDDFQLLETGRGYSACIFNPHGPTYEGLVSAKTLVLPEEGRTDIGLRGTEAYLQEWASIENLTTGEVRSAWEDYQHADPWINWNFVYLNSFTKSYEICVLDGSGDDVWMHPWYGYMVWSFERNTRLIFNRPW